MEKVINLRRKRQIFELTDPVQGLVVEYDVSVSGHEWHVYHFGKFAIVVSNHINKSKIPTKRVRILDFDENGHLMDEVIREEKNMDVKFEIANVKEDGCGVGSVKFDLIVRYSVNYAVTLRLHI